MALLTPLSLDEARDLGRLYGVDVETISPIVAGSVNSNFSIGGRDGPRFLRIYEEQSEVTARREARLLDHLADEGVPTPRPLRRVDGSGFISVLRDKPVAVFPFVEGTSICQRGVHPEMTREVGRALRAIHDAGRRMGSDLEGAIGPSRFGRAALRERLDRIAETRPAPEIAATCAQIRPLLEQDVGPSLMEGLIHGDLFRDNVLWSDRALTSVLDFESASTGSLAFDLMVTVLAWCFGDSLDHDLVTALARGYSGDRSLAEAFEVDVPAAVLADDLLRQGLFACARFAVTRITDFELRPRGTVAYKDFRRWRARAKALEELGKSRLGEILGVC